MNMDPDQLRLILLMVGIAIIVAIYLWDRYQRSRRKLKGLSLRQARKIRKEYGLDEMDDDEVPSFTAVVTKVPAPERTQAEPAPPPPPPPAEEPPSEPEPPPSPREEQPPLPLEEPEPPPPEPAYDDEEELPQLVIQIGVVAKGDHFTGPDVLVALRELGLEPGAMSIFHAQLPGHPGRPLFSVANLVEPGYFPLDAMEEFTTPGLLFFAQLPGLRDGIEIYEQMLDAAQRLARRLGGTLQDENRSTLSKQSIQHTKDAIAEHRRQLQLALKKQRRDR